MRALDIAQLRWQNRGKRHQGVGKAYLINGVGRAPWTSSSMWMPRGAARPPQGPALSGARELDISPMLARIHAGAPPVSGQLDFQLWSEFEKGRLGNSPAGLWQQPPDLEGRDQGEPHRLDLQGGKIQLRRDGEAWQLASHDVIFKLDGATWLHSRLQLERIGSRIQGYVPAIDIDQIANLSQLVSGLYPELTETLKRTRPRGQLQELVLQADGDWQGLSVQGQLRGFGTRPGTMCPVCKKLDGDFWLTPNGDAPA